MKAVHQLFRGSDGSWVTLVVGDGSLVPWVMDHGSCDSWVIGQGSWGLSYVMGSWVMGHCKRPSVSSEWDINFLHHHQSQPTHEWNNTAGKKSEARKLLSVPGFRLLRLDRVSSALQMDRRENSTFLLFYQSFFLAVVHSCSDYSILFTHWTLLAN